MFPSVPCFARLSTVPFLADRLLTGTLLLLICVFAATSENPRRRRSLVIAMLATSAALVMLNQHRLQPWHWLFVLITAASMPGIRDRLRLWRLTIASVYIYAGLSRVGPGVADEMSLRVLQTILSAVSAEHGMRNDHFVFAACLTMSVSEILVGVLLLWRRFRRGGVIASVGLHLTLLAVLGPWGLKQQAGVLLWNLYFLLAVPALFWSTPNASQLPREEGGAAPKTSRSASFFAAFVVLAPLSGLFSMADNWPSWQLYSPRPEVIRVFVRQDSVNQLPLSAQEFVMPPLPLDVWCPVRIDLWSLRATGSPIYPEDRFQLAIAGYLMRSVPVDSLRISVESPDRPTWWTRSTQEYSALAQLEALEADFVLNSSTVRLHEP